MTCSLGFSSSRGAHLASDVYPATRLRRFSAYARNSSSNDWKDSARGKFSNRTFCRENRSLGDMTPGNMSSARLTISAISSSPNRLERLYGLFGIVSGIVIKKLEKTAVVNFVLNLLH